MNLPEDVHKITAALADLKGISLGEALEELVPRGSANAIDLSKPFPCFVLPQDAERITLEHTASS